MVDRNYRLFITGMLSGDLAYQVLAVAAGWHVFTLERNPFDLGLIGIALFIPIAVFAIPAGMFVDHHDRRLIATVSSVVQAAGCFGLMAVVILDVRTVFVYLAILFVIGCGRAFSQPATRTLLPNIVAREHYVRAQAGFMSFRQLVTIGGPAVGGALVGISTPIAFLVCAIAYLGSGTILGTLRMQVEAERRSTAAGWSGALQGLHFIMANPTIRGAITLDLFAVLFSGAVPMLPAFADEIFHVGSTGLGIMRSTVAVGATLVAAWLSRHPPTSRIGTQLLITVTGFGIATIGFGLSRNFWLSLVFLAIIGGTDMLSMVIRNGLVQMTTPDNLRGRVSAIEGVFIGASNQIGAFEAGTVAAFVGVGPSVVIGGIGTLLVIFAASQIFPELRRYDKFAGEAVAS